LRYSYNGSFLASESWEGEVNHSVEFAYNNAFDKAGVTVDDTTISMSMMMTCF